MKSYFSLKTPTATEPTPIIFFVVCNDKRLKFGTGEKVHPNQFKDGQILISKNRHKLEPIDHRLNNLVTKADKFFRNCDFEGRPVLADELREFLKPAKVDSAETVNENDLFFTDFQRMIDMATTGELLTEKSKNRYSRNLLSQWRLILSNLKKLAAHRDDIILSHHKMTIEAVTIFRSWMMEKGAAKNYIGSQVKAWRRVLEIMYDRGMHKNEIFRHKLFKPESEVVYKAFLNEDDILAIYNYARPGHWLEKVRDRWLVMYCTGIRVSDSRRLKVSHILEDKIILINKKTGKRVVVPKHEILIEILDKYHGLPDPISEQQMNKQIKEIAEWVGLDAPVTYKITKGGVEHEVTKPKWQLITNHTARRSLVSNMIANNVDYQIGGSIVGMSPKTWSIYNKLRNDEKVTILAGNPVFKKPLSKKQRAS